MILEYNGERLELRLSKYGNGNLAVEAVCEDGEPYAVLSVNMPPYEPLPEGVFYLKDWSENAVIGKAFIDSGLIERVDLPIRGSGFVFASAYRFVKESA